MTEQPDGRPPQPPPPALPTVGGLPVYQPDPGAAPQWATPTSTLAKWAFGLSFVPCGISLITSLVLAIVVLTSRGRHTGRKLALGALAMIGVWAVVLVVAVIVAIATEDSPRNDAGDVVNQGEISNVDLRPGDCVIEPKGDTIYSVTVLPCASKHDAEVYATFKLKGSRFPGDARIGRSADAGCAQRFRAYVGKRYAVSELKIFLILPQRSSWELGNRLVTCMVTLPDDAQATGTLRNARR